jgi:fermentation-respiration switch protein FrsA (DUF1100 family)
VLLLIENWFLFHPTTDIEMTHGLEPVNVELTAADGTKIHAWWCEPENWEPTNGALVHCHGNAGNLSGWGHDALAWNRERKTAVLLFDFPGYGQSSGKPNEAGCYVAADAAYDWLVNEKKIPAETLLIYGQSLGGAVAIDLASRRPHKALIVVSSFTSFPDMAQQAIPFFPARYLVRNQWNSERKIARCSGLVFIAHGTADELIPFEHGERLFAAATNAKRKQFYTARGFDHNNIDQGMYPQLMEFLAEKESPR